MPAASVGRAEPEAPVAGDRANVDFDDEQEKQFP